MQRLDKTFKPVLNEDYNQMLDYFVNTWSQSKEVQRVIISNSYLKNKYGQYIDPTFDWSVLDEDELSRIWNEWSVDEDNLQRQQSELNEDEEKTFMLDGEELPVHFKLKRYDKNRALAVELWDTEGPYATISSNLEASSTLPADEFYLKHWGENEYLAQELINKKVIISTGQQEDELGAQSYKIAPQYTQGGVVEVKIPPQYQSNVAEQEHEGSGEAVNDNDEFFEITAPVGSGDEQMFIGVVNQGIDSHLEGFGKSKFDVRQGSLGARRIFNFHKSELPILLRRLRNLGTEEADSWANDIENYDSNLDEMTSI